jgi:hypothetical protein
MKAKNRSEVRRFEDIPNVGPRIREDFERLGITNPVTLADHDPYTLYRKLEKITGKRQDPCVLDTFMAVIDFMQGAPARPWYWYTPVRKKKYSNLHHLSTTH